MKEILLLALLLLAGYMSLIGKIGLYYLGKGRGQDYVDYKIRILSTDAKNIKVYLPFPHYRGKPDMKILNWLKEVLEDYKKSLGYPPETKIELINTEYGKMLYIYIHSLKEGKRRGLLFKIDSTFAKPTKVNQKTVIKDYKLTGEDKMEPVKEGDHPKWKEYYLLQEFNMPIYVEFEGDGLNIGFEYRMFVTEGELISGYFGYNFGDIYKVDNNPLNFTKSGWHWITIEKRINKYIYKVYKEEK